ncbi:DUF4915 domain-containing protein [Bdellovibrionota bacterium FG-2]
MNLEEQWQADHLEFRNPQQVISQWYEGSEVSSEQLEFTTEGDFFDLLQEMQTTLIISREYEHFLIALTVHGGCPLITFLRLPHPSGIAVSPDGKEIVVASTRNPNQLIFYKPVERIVERKDIAAFGLGDYRPLVPYRSLFLSGSHYLHDLAYIGEVLHANSVGQNGIIKVTKDGSSMLAWWPKAAEREGKLESGVNYLQLNSIAAGDSIEDSFFSASTDKLCDPRPGHPEFLADRAGVLFSGKTREVIAQGLTRPHSARLFGGKVWIDNSGYGEVGYIDGDRFQSTNRLPGWTRGLLIRDKYMIVGTSVIIPRFASYAPGLESSKCRCGIHIIDRLSSQVLASLYWPQGNQIFAIEAATNQMTTGFPYAYIGGRKVELIPADSLFYSYLT